MTQVLLLAADGTRSTLTLRPAPEFTRPASPLTSRSVYAAAHVVPHAWADNVPGEPAGIDWDATLGVRRHLWSWGLGVADAMDTAQRGMGLDPAATRELIVRSATAAREEGGALVVGVGTDHLDDDAPTLAQVVDAYARQLVAAEDAGAGVVLMASRHLARVAAGPGDYERVYREVLARAGAPVVLHWLGPAFDPQLTGYFGSTDPGTAAKTLLRIVADAGPRVVGLKMSLLDADAEIAVRDALPAGVRMFTGDDFNYVDLIAGDEAGHSDALLGAFAAIAPAASASIQALDRGDVAAYREVLAPSHERVRSEERS